ncbi:MAG: hypothetical protein AABW89_00410 [Nanoarchaeota archaeon]
MDNEEIKKEARELLDKFGKDLTGFKIESKLNFKGGELRKEKPGEDCDIDFKTIMFKNAPRKNEECLILEKAHWN